jgi:hypothetical protein
MSPRPIISRAPIRPERIRDTRGGFAFIPGRFLRDGFFASLDHRERSLYLFLVLAGDRNGVSYYGQDRICSLLEMHLDEYLIVRNGLIAKDLIAFDGTRFQVLSLPPTPRFVARRPLTTQDDLEDSDPATIRSLLARELGSRR